MIDRRDILNKSISNFELKINPEYANLVPPLTDPEYNSFKQSIKNNGLWYPITINQQGIVLDGHHRFKACQELGIIPNTEVKTFDSLLEEKLYVIDCNLQRRDLNPFQKIVLTLKRKPILQELAKQNMSKGGKGDLIKSTLDTNKEVGKIAGVGKDTVRKVERILEKGSQEVINKLRQGKSTINKVYKKMDEDEKRHNYIDEAPKGDLPNGCKLILGNFIEKCRDIPDKSIHLIFTDPLYAEKDIYLYQELLDLADRVLVDGGSLVSFPNFNLPKTHEIFSSKLKFWCEVCVKHNGHINKIKGRDVYADWKPLLWYVKGDKPRIINNAFHTFIESEPPRKDLLPWAQSDIEAEYMIKNLTVENETVLDPFLGIGTFGLAALKLNRQFIGIEINPQTFAIAEGRLLMRFTKSDT
jgi:16S rRNA G966 N2-methylase RsmD